MAEKIVMLALSPTMETGTIVKWHKKEGDAISSGDLLCEVETDKATMDYESTAEGTLLKIISAEGSQVKVGETIGIAGNPGEDVSDLAGQPEPQTKKTETQKKTPVSITGKTESQNIAPSESVEHFPSDVKSSPLARQLAGKYGVDIHSIGGSGPGGRIIKDDVLKATRRRPSEVSLPSEKREFQQRIAISDKRRIIAQRMTQSVTTAPHFYLTVSVRMDHLIDSRDSLNSRLKRKISFNAFMIKLTAEALSRNPVVNSSWTSEAIVRHGTVDIGLAVAQKDGLVTPVVRDCGGKGILAIDEELRDLVSRGREGRLSPDEYTGATFTISNLGSYGVRQFTAIINPPASAILAVGEIFDEFYITADGEWNRRKSMLMTLSSDHRVIDGAVAAEFAGDLKKIMENPITVLY